VGAHGLGVSCCAYQTYNSAISYMHASICSLARPVGSSKPSRSRVNQPAKALQDRLHLLSANSVTDNNRLVQLKVRRMLTGVADLKPGSRGTFPAVPWRSSPQMPHATPARVILFLSKFLWLVNLLLYSHQRLLHS
jgi:hypothetical protein